MDFNSSDYFAYKKNKIQGQAIKQEKKISKLNFLFQIFITTFIIMFIIIVIVIMKYSTKVDIEYSKNSPLNNSSILNDAQTEEEIYKEQQGKIDKRLLLIQQEENAPYEAKIIEKQNPEEVINPIHLEKNKKIENNEKFEQTKELQKDDTKDILKPKITNPIDELTSNSTKKTQENIINKNITIMSKVLIGRYSTLEEAQKAQAEIKSLNLGVTPFVKKVGDVFSVQMGSYQDFTVAKNHAQNLKAKGYDVWIYQQ